MSARSHHRVTPGWPGSTPTPARQAGPRLPNYTHGRPTVCDYCGRSMTGQEFRGDKCLDCRVRDGEAEVDENGEEVVDD